MNVFCSVHMRHISSVLSHHMYKTTPVSAASPHEEQQVPDSEQASPCPPGEERHAGHSGRDGE